MRELRTHRGFLISRKPPEPGFMALDMVDGLYEHYRANVDCQHDLNFVTDVARAAKIVLYHNGMNILKNQLWHPSSRWVLSFTVSTLDYVNGERRMISVENYRDLLEFHPKSAVNFDSSANHAKLRQWERILNLPEEEFISLWLSRDAGLNDLVVSLQLIAGKLPDEYTQHPKPL